MCILDRRSSTDIPAGLRIRGRLDQGRRGDCGLLSAICYLFFCGQPTSSMFQLFLSSSAPSEIVSRLHEFVDPEEMDPYKPSLYRGERPIIGRVEGHDFHFRKRLKGPWYWTVLTPAFWFKPALHGTVTPKRNGSEVLVEGGVPLAAKISWAVLFLAIATFFGIFAVLSYPGNINFDPAHVGFDMQLALLLMNIVLGILLLIPLIGWLATRSELDFLTSELQSRLNLKPTTKIEG
jgi:hypothetical protein